MSTTIEPIPEGFAQIGGPRWPQDKIKEQIEARLETVRPIVASKGADHMTPAEFRKVKTVNDEVEILEGGFLEPHIGHPVQPGSRAGDKLGGSFYEAIMKAGWDPVTRSRVSVPAEAALFKAVTTTGDVEDYFPRVVPSTALGADRRYLYPALRQVNVSALDTSVQYLNQSARTLATPGDMIRDLDAVTAKPETALTVELASADLKQVAHKVSGVPNIVAKQRPFRDLIENDLRLGLSEALDDLVDDAITAAAVPMAVAGTNIAEKIRYAMAEVEDAGYSPDTVALSPDEAVALDILSLTLNNSTSQSPLFGLRPRISKALILAIVFDSRAFASLHAGPIEFASFEENDGATNSQLFRAELNAVAVVDRAAAGCEVWGS
jgi:hypothetical protein